MRYVASLTALCAGLSAGCARAPQRFVNPFEPQAAEWRRVYADDTFTVSVDAAHILPGPEPGTVELWYQNQHAVLREANGMMWNREVIYSLLRCDPLSFKTVLTTVFKDDGPAVAQIGGTLEDVRDRPWKDVIPGSVDEGSLRGACEVAARTAGENFAGF